MRLNQLHANLRSCADVILSSSETNLALSDLATAPVRANLASRQVRDESLDSASFEAKIVFDYNTISALIELRPKLAHPAKLRPKYHAALAQLSHAAKLI